VTAFHGKNRTQIMPVRFLLFLFVFLLPGVPAVLAQYTPARLKTLDSTLTVMHRYAAFNGVVLVAENGKILYEKALGISNCETRIPLSTTSAFNLASVSKQFMAMMIMMLQEKGKLQFDDPIQRFLPSLPYDKITIRHLLTHTSGLP
jgi:CubicO group peptidase (beta-lactamase class C family)